MRDHWLTTAGNKGQHIAAARYLYDGTTAPVIDVYYSPQLHAHPLLEVPLQERHELGPGPDIACVHFLGIEGGSCQCPEVAGGHLCCKLIGTQDALNRISELCNDSKAGGKVLNDAEVIVAGQQAAVGLTVIETEGVIALGASPAWQGLSGDCQGKHGALRVQAVQPCWQSTVCI